MSNYYATPFQRVAVGNRDEFSHPSAVKAALAEFLATAIFVFAAEGSVIAYTKQHGGSDLSPAGLTAIALANAAALFAATSFAFNHSGGHLNPVVTLGLMCGGHITVFRSILYWIAQLVGAVVGCLLLLASTGGLPATAQVIEAGESWWDAFILEIVITFGLVSIFYATVVDPRAKDNVYGNAPLVIGLMYGANILVAGPFDGGSMNPARSFGPALVSFDWTNHWLYWAGPAVGGFLAAIVYEAFFFPHDSFERPPPE